MTGSFVCLITLQVLSGIQTAYAETTPATQAKPDPTNDVSFQRPFIIGIVAFNKEDYARAIEKFKAALQVAPDNKGALTYLMFAGFKANDGKTTADAGDRLIALGDDTSRTLFITARGHRLAGNEAQARIYFSQIADRDDDPYLDSAEFALSETGLNYRPKGLRGSLTLAYEHDTNISASPSDSSSTTGTDLADDRWVITASLQYNHRIGERYYVGGSLVALDQFYDGTAARNFEIDLARFGIHGGMVGSGWDVKLAYEHEELGFGHDEYIQTERGILTYNQRITNNYRITLVGRIADDIFKQSSIQDAVKTDYEFNNSILLPFVTEGARLSLDYRYRKNDTDDTSVFSYDSDQYRVGIFSPLPWWSTYIDVSYTREDRDYDEPNPTVVRSDKYTEQSFKLGKVWTRNLRNEIYYHYYDASSNIAQFEYDQETTGINFIYSF
jgi:tetratricopeptide (TPR) repeat protein